MRRFIITLLCTLTLSAVAGNSAGLSEYFDNRTGVFHYSMDDYGDNAADDMIYAMELCREAGVPAEVAVITSYCSQDSWDRLQEQLDLGGVTIACHSKYHRNPDTYPDGDETTLWTWDELDLDVQEGFADIEANLTLPERHRFNGDNYCTSWIQPWGTAVGNEIEYHDRVRGLFYDLGVLNDKNGNKADTNPENLLYAEWDETYSTFGRTGESGKWNTWDYGAQVSYHVANILNGGVSSTYSHPQKKPWLTYLTDETADPSYTNTLNQGYYQYRVVKDIAGRDDTWYCGLSDLYQYRYLTTIADTTLTCTEDTTGATIFFGCPLADRQRYGLSIPITIVYTNDTAIATENLTAYYKGQNDLRYHPLKARTATEQWNDSNGYRTDGDVMYITAALPQTGTNYTIRVATANPDPFQPAIGDKLLIAIP